MSDTTPPQCYITYPIEGQTVAGRITVSSDNADWGGLGTLAFYVDGKLKDDLVIGDGTSDFQWNTRKEADGAHSIYLVSVDHAGNRTTSKTVNVRVSNKK